MTEADLDRWQPEFQPPDVAGLRGAGIPEPGTGWSGWPEWAADHWPSCLDR